MSDLATELRHLAEVEEKIVAVELEITQLAAALAGRQGQMSRESKVALEAAKLALKAFHERRMHILYVVDGLTRDSLR